MEDENKRVEELLRAAAGALLLQGCFSSGDRVAGC